MASGLPATIVQNSTRDAPIHLPEPPLPRWPPTAVHRSLRAIIVQSPLAYIGKASRTKRQVGRDVIARRFRLGGKKEGAGAAVAVILAWIMAIE